MKRSSFLSLCLGSPIIISKSSAQSRAERGKQLMDEVVAGLGGSKFQTMRDRVEHGRAYSFYRDRLSGRSLAKIYTRYLMRPEPPKPDFFGLRERQAFGKNEDNAVIFTEDNAWEVTFRGAKPMEQALQDRFRDSTRRNIFYILRQRLGEPGLIAEYQRADVLDNQPVEIVEFADGDNRTVTVFFNRTTKLPVRQIYFRRDPLTKDRIEEVTIFSRYREVNGVQWPHTIERNRNGEKIYEIFADTVTINQNLSDNLFALPSNMKLLKPDKPDK
jgi:hypothetical protein